MASSDMKFGVLFLFQVVFGTAGNLALLCHYCILSLRGCRSRATDVILRHLTMANTMVIVCRSFPETIAAFGVQDFLSDIGCKLMFYGLTLGRSMSFSTTCLLSVFQAISISPMSSRWPELKAKALKSIVPCTVICWVLHMLTNIRVPLLMTNKRSYRNNTNMIDFQYCSARAPGKDQNNIFMALSLSHDILSLKLMIWSSSSMVLILYRHQQRTRHIHTYSTTRRPSPKARASQSILTLVCTFVCFYILTSFTYVWLSLYDKQTWWLIKACIFSTGCFPTISPFILMRREHGVCRSVCKV